MSGNYSQVHFLYYKVLLDVNLTFRFYYTVVATHKFIVVFCVGLDLATNDTALSSFIFYMTILSLASPLGIATGIAITESSLLSDPVQHSITVNALQGYIELI